MTLMLALTGDVNLRNLPDPGKPFVKGSSGPNGVDLLFGNLEGCFFDSDQELPYKPGWYHVGTSLASGLVQLGFDAVGCANNVTFGADAITSSLAILDDMGIPHTGAGVSREAAHSPVVLSHDGIRIGFIQRTSVFWPAGHEASISSPGVATVKAHTAYQPHSRIREMPGGPATVLTWPDPESLKRYQKDIRSLRSEVDVLIVSDHWGISSSQETAQYQVAVGRAAVEAGADVVIGHGPHLMQGVEIYRGKPIFYSLGNFVFGWEKMRGRKWVGLVVWVRVDDGGVAEVSCSPVCPDEQERATLLPVPQDSPAYRELQALSESHGTKLAVHNDRIVVWRRL